MLAKVENATALCVLDGFQRTLGTLPEHLRKTLTYDQGKEMALHRALPEGTGLAIYFADPHSPWHAASAKTPMGCFTSTCPKAPTCPCTRNDNSMPSPGI